MKYEKKYIVQAAHKKTGIVLDYEAVQFTVSGQYMFNLGGKRFYFDEYKQMSDFIFRALPAFSVKIKRLEK